MSNEQKFPVGAKVKLKSGGPDMTVAGFGEYGHEVDQYLCKWFDVKTNGYKSDHFSAAMLDEVAEEPPGPRKVKSVTGW